MCFNIHPRDQLIILATKKVLSIFFFDPKHIFFVFCLLNLGKMPLFENRLQRTHVNGREYDQLYFNFTKSGLGDFWLDLWTYIWVPLLCFVKTQSQRIYSCVSQKSQCFDFWCYLGGNISIQSMKSSHSTSSTCSIFVSHLDHKFRGGC